MHIARTALVALILAVALFASGVFASSNNNINLKPNKNVNSAAGTCSGSNSLSFNIDMSSRTEFPHYWERCVGSGHAALALRQDYRDQLIRVVKELGMQSVRFHGLFDDDMSAYLPGFIPPYQYYNIDSIFDFFLSLGMKPIVELSFMPEALASGNETIFHYKGNITPPKDYNAWYDFIQAFILHIVERYGIEEIRNNWRFEVWNEPNCGFFSGTQQEYFTLYNYTATAVKSVDKNILVGGPATCQSQWIPEFLEFCDQNNVPVDFITTHQYPTDITPLDINILPKVVKQTKAAAGNLPVFYTEWNAGLGTAVYQDSSYAAAFIAKTVKDIQGLVEVFSFWAFSDIFEEGGFMAQPFGIANRFGLLNMYGVAKPAYRAFQLLHQAGDEMGAVSAQTANENSTVYILPLFDSIKQQVMIFISNIDVLTNPQPPVWQVCLNVAGVVPNTKSGAPQLLRIDAFNANPYGLWEKMGSPQYPTQAQIQQLVQASEVPSETIQWQPMANSQGATFQVSVPAYGLAVIVFNV